MGNALGCSCEAKGGTPLIEIKKKRGCTDVPLLVVFVALWVLVIVLLSLSIDKGANPNRLTHGSDYQDRICGIDDEVKELRLLAWPKVPVNSELGSISVCVASCSETTVPLNFTGRGMFRYITQPTGYKTAELFGRCLPSNDAGDEVLDVAGVPTESAVRAVGDLTETVPLLAYSAILSIILAFFYLWFCKRFAGILVWFTIITVLAGGVLLGYTLLNEASKAKDSVEANPERRQIMEYSSYAAFGFTVIFLVILALRKRIKIAVGVVKEASKSIGYMPSMMFFPLIPLILSMAYFAFWVWGALHIFSVSIKTEQKVSDIDAEIASALGGSDTVMVSREWDESMQNTFAIHFFHLLWNIQFFIYFGYMVIAGCVANWYFTPYGDNGEKPRGTGPLQLPRAAVRNSATRTIRYHLGTIAFGSLLIAIVQFIRAIIKYIEKQSKGKKKRLKKALFCAIQCCLKCVQCCVDKLSKNAFIYCAIYGEPFCTSACSSFAILWRNLIRVAAISMVGDYISLLGKLLVSFGSTGIAVFALGNVEPFKSADISSPVLTAFLVFMLSYVVASIFIIVYETAVDTVFLCFFIDEEQNNNAQNLLASKNLLAIINKHSAQSKPNQAVLPN